MIVCVLSLTSERPKDLLVRRASSLISTRLDEDARAGAIYHRLGRVRSGEIQSERKTAEK